MGAFTSAWFQVMLIQTEILLGLLLLSGRAPIGAWLVAFVLFTCFAVFTFYQGWVGYSSCGCFSRPLSPWIAFGIDVGVLAALGIGRPDLAILRHNPRRVLERPLIAAAGWFGGGAIVFSGLVGAASWHFGSLDAAAAHIRGEPVAVVPHSVDIGDGTLGESRKVQVRVTNYTDRPLRIVGGTSDCSCVTTIDLPIMIPAGESRAVVVAIRLSASPGIFTRTALFVTDDNQFPAIYFQMTGRSLPAE
jgi:hypothetical protein